MYILLFFVYLVLFTWLLTRIRFIRSSGISATQIALLFWVKVFFGLMYGWISYTYYPGSDNWYFHQQGLREYDLLFENPGAYLSGFFTDNVHQPALGDIFHTNSYWNNLRSTIIAKLLSVFNILSFGNYYINTLIYNFFVFFGFIALFKIFLHLFPDKKQLLIIGVFLLPSVLYFSSGIHRDGLIFLGVATVAYNAFVQLRHGLSFKRSVLLLLALIFTFLLRTFVVAALLPAFITWLIAEKKPKYALQIFIVCYILYTIAFFTVSSIHPKLDLPKFVSDRQIEFISIARNASSTIHINPLFPTARSFFNNAPQALNHSMMRPYPAESMSMAYAPFAVEILLYELFFLLLLLFPRRGSPPAPFIYFAIAFGITMMLIIGYTIPIIGAFVRYRSIYFPFIILPVLCYIDWDRLKQLLIYNKNI